MVSDAVVIGLDYTELSEWEEFDSFRLLEIMGSCDAPWWVAGGWALDLWLGRATRKHQDLDVAVLRADQCKLYKALRRGELYYATTDHRLLPLRPGHWLEPPLYGVWARREPEAPWLCEFLLNEHKGEEWLYPRNPAVRMPLAEMGSAIAGGIPVLVPEIVLLYKAHERTEKDEADFQSALPTCRPLPGPGLVGTLMETTPEHPWMAQLRD
jgi:Aminoglycoside-2''-adenylyltransferase